jgi:hypothetical protein
MAAKLRTSLHTADDRMLAMMRVALGSVAIVHAIQHIGTSSWSVVASTVEAVAGAMLIMGVLGRFTALAVGASAIAAAAVGDRPEYWLLALVTAALLVTRGSGAWSIDRLMLARFVGRLSSPIQGRSMYVSWTWFHLPYMSRW